MEKNSTCIRLKIAAVIVKDDRIISSGWNGAPSGMIHCNEYFEHVKDTNSEDFKKLHAEFSERNELHAEQNAIAFAARNGINTEGSILFTSVSPCASCAKLIIAAGIKTVYYKVEYDRSNAGLDLLNDCNIETICIGE